MNSTLVVSKEKDNSLCEKLKNKESQNLICIENFFEINDKILSKVDSVLISAECAKQILEKFNNPEEIENLKNQNQKLQNKIDEIRLINRAKCVLIQCLSMTEQQAHRYIEKQSMDLRQSRSTTAESILKTYEN